MLNPPKVRAVFAHEAPLAVVVATYSGKLSRMLLWDTKRDLVTRSIWVKARIIPLDLSADGEHFVYYAMAFSKQIPAYIAVSRPPCFTALFFREHLYRMPAGAFFGPRQKLLIALTPVEENHRGRPFAVKPRLEPGCPYDLEVVEVEDFHDECLAARFAAESFDAHSRPGNEPLVQSYSEEARAVNARDRWPGEYRSQIEALMPIGTRNSRVFTDRDHHGRFVFSPGDGCLYVFDKGASEPRKLFDFNDRSFEEVVPPDWATKWRSKRPPSEFPRHKLQ